jgi:uncharacterized protein (DUF2249 family)
MTRKTITVDVREDIRTGCQPFSKIMAAVNGLGNGQELLIIAPFEPMPLYPLMQKLGFQHSSGPIPSGDWEVLFTRSSDAPLPSSDQPPRGCGSVSTIEEIVEVDARGLEPPQPLVKILEALVGLPQNAQLDARTDRRPMHLYAQLEERGFAGVTNEQSDGSFLTHIRRR